MQTIGFEPTRVSPSGFKPDAFANYATSAKTIAAGFEPAGRINPVSSLAMRRYKPLTHATIFIFSYISGESGIRTQEPGIYRSAVFKTAAINHSAKSP